MTRALNLTRGDKDPSNWIPPASSQVCRYLADWLAVKARWGLTMNQAEANSIAALLADQCPGLVVADWPGIS